jgi:hypothetical protein
LFSPDAKNEYEQYTDASRMDGLGNVSTLASYSSDNPTMLAINHMHSIDSTTRIKLYVNVSASTGIDTLSGSGFETLDSRYDAWLIDHYKKDSLFFSRYKNYLFNIDNADTGSYGANRFEIVFHKKNELDYKLVNFTATPVKEGVMLKWQTANETDLTGFAVQRQNEAKEFASLHSLQSNGSGSYSYLDQSPQTGVNYYRLQQDDAFREISYSKVIGVTINGAGITAERISLYPNPVKSQFTVTINTDVPDKATLMVINNLGQVLVNRQTDGNNITQGVSNLQPGSYVVQITDTRTKKVVGVKKFIKQ